MHFPRRIRAARRRLRSAGRPTKRTCARGGTMAAVPLPADYKLADLLGIAGATIGIIIAAGVLLQCFSTRYIAVFERYRALAGEYRGEQVSDPRRGNLRNELVDYRRQIRFL